MKQWNMKFGKLNIGRIAIRPYGNKFQPGAIKIEFKFSTVRCDAGSNCRIVSISSPKKSQRMGNFSAGGQTSSNLSAAASIISPGSKTVSTWSISNLRPTSQKRILFHVCFLPMESFLNGNIVTTWHGTRSDQPACRINDDRRRFRFFCKRQLICSQSSHGLQAFAARLHPRCGLLIEVDWVRRISSAATCSKSEFIEQSQRMVGPVGDQQDGLI